MRIPSTLATLLLITSYAFATEPCQRIRGRAILYLGDGQFRLWHVGTHHEFALGENDESWNVLAKYMKDANGVATNVVFVDFLVCPTAPLVKGAAQPAVVKSLSHPIVLTQEEWAAMQKR